MPKQQGIVAQVVEAAAVQHLHNKHSWKGASLRPRAVASIDRYPIGSTGWNSPAAVDNACTGNSSAAGNHGLLRT